MMSALGQKRSFDAYQLNVRFTPKAVIRSRAVRWLLLTQSGHSDGKLGWLPMRSPKGFFQDP